MTPHDNGLGLRMRVDVHGECPLHTIKPLLDLFGMFHGPHNEVCIRGSGDSQHAFGIKRSIPMGGVSREDVQLDTKVSKGSTPRAGPSIDLRRSDRIGFSSTGPNFAPFRELLTLV